MGLYINEIEAADVRLADGPNRDAFGRLRTSSVLALLDSKQLYDTRPLFWDTELIGGGTSTHVPADSVTTLAVSANADAVIRQTFARTIYQPGKSQLLLCTGTLSTQAGVTKRVGLIESATTTPWTPTDGLYFENDGTGISVVINKGGSATKVGQSVWNLDKLDGRGPSGLTLDLTKAQIFVIDFEWLGIGRVRWGFDIGGTIRYAHETLNSNILTAPYITTPNLPVRYEIRSTGGAGSMAQICCVVASESGFDPAGAVRTRNTGIAPTAVIDCGVVGTEYLLVGLRLQAAKLGILVTPLKVSVITYSNNPFFWTLRLNPAIGDTPVWADLANSDIQTAIGVIGSDPSPTTVAGGILIAGGYASNNVDVANVDLNPIRNLGAALDGTLDVLALSVTFDSVNEDAHGAITWREQI